MTTYGDLLRDAPPGTGRLLAFATTIGSKIERDAVVAYLRGKAIRLEKGHFRDEAGIASALADQIAAGDHCAEGGAK